MAWMDDNDRWGCDQVEMEEHVFFLMLSIWRRAENMQRGDG